MSRMADQLGKGASFSRTTGGVSARRKAVAATTGAPTTGAPDSRLRTLPLTQLVPTRFNPRRNFGTEEDLREFGQRLKAKQLQPAVAVTREAYLGLWPDEANAVGEATYVIANGERRYRASQAASLPTLEVVIDDEVARSRADFLNAILSENNDREDLDPIERALGIKTMVDQLGGKAKVAEYYGKSAGWVTQQMYLLNLTPELQDLVSSGTLPVRETRPLVKLPPSEQKAAWEARTLQREVEKSQPKPSRRPRTEAHQESNDEGNREQGSFTAVKKETAASHETEAGPESFTAVKPTLHSQEEPAAASISPTSSLPEQRPIHALENDLPWEDPQALLTMLMSRMTHSNRAELTKLLLEANMQDTSDTTQ
ncbi:ParB/RepB/Spo0J family partition protein [Streptomyces diacarni]|uniref:ParB/RepB/Spo0J family partition protein n=1 Tax=Streptomyces diacarni TaxID=2800381 RepID=UPI0033E7FBF5